MARARKMPRAAMRPTLALAMILIIAGALVTLWEYGRIQGAVGDAHSEFAIVAAPGGQASIEIPLAGGREWMIMTVVADGHFSIRSDGAKITGGPAPNRFSSAGESRFCRTDAQDQPTCNIPIRKDNSTATIRFFGENATAPFHADVSVSLRKFKRATATSPEKFTVALIAVAILIPLVWLTHRSIAASQWLIVATAVGLLFYIEPFFATCALGFILCLYRLTLAISAGPDRRRRSLFWGLAACGSFLVAFKYGGEAIFAIMPDIGGLALALPLGLSYFVIRVIDTLLHAYRGALAGADIRSFLCYMVFPATIPAGPIMTYDRFRGGRLARIRSDDLAFGFGRILFGLFKKLIVADLLLNRLIFHPDYGVFDAVVMNPAGAEGGVVIAYLALNFLYVYVDFSAYSDIAIGLGRLLGYRIDENFRFPLIVTSLRQYWQRWHMTLSNWCMRNVFMPVALLTRTQLAATLSVFIVIGLWHDASANWFFWGLHHGLGVAALMWLSRRRLPAVPRFLRPALSVAGGCATFLYVAAGHSFVSLNNLQVSLGVYFSFWKALLFLD